MGHTYTVMALELDKIFNNQYSHCSKIINAYCNIICIINWNCIQK